MEAMRQQLESQRRKRLAQLNVAQDAIQESELGPDAPPVDPSTSIRIMQWNVLADGLSDDGFLVLPNLKESEWPCSRTEVPTIHEGKPGKPEKFKTLIKEMLAAKGNSEALEQLKAKYDTKEANRNLNAVIDAEARERQMLLTVLSAGLPDIVVLEELDHYRSMAEGMARLGYSSRLPGSTSEYMPMHMRDNDIGSEEGRERFCKAIASNGHAFLPKLGSNAMLFRIKNQLGKEEEVMAAARKLGLESEVIDRRGNWLSKHAFGRRGSGPLLREAGIEDPRTLDDDGIGIFWRTDRLQAERLDVLMYPNSGSGALKVCFRDLRSAREFSVVGTHLGSGDSRKDEDGRLSDQVDFQGGLSDWVASSRKKNEALVLCLDANSDPQEFARKVETPEGQSSCWRSLRAALGASVWDEYFDEDGNLRPTSSQVALGPPVSTNKVRGPASGQPKKIGSHAYYCIDHIFYSTEHFSLLRHAFPVRRFKSADVALEAVLPSLAVPSDHYPVVVDILWGPALGHFPADFASEMKALARQVQQWTTAQLRQDASAADICYGNTYTCMERLAAASTLRFEICQQIHDLALCIATTVICSIFREFDNAEQREEDLRYASTPMPHEVSAPLWWKTQELFRASATKACRQALGEVEAERHAQMELDRLEQAIAGP